MAKIEMAKMEPSLGEKLKQMAIECEDEKNQLEEQKKSSKVSQTLAKARTFVERKLASRLSQHVKPIAIAELDLSASDMHNKSELFQCLQVWCTQEKLQMIIAYDHCVDCMFRNFKKKCQTECDPITIDFVFAN